MGRGPFDLAAQDATGRHLDRLAVHGQEVAEDEHAPRQPGERPDRPGIDHRVEVAVSGLPVGELVAGQRGHVDIAGQQVVAHLDPVVHHVLQEEGPGDPLPDRSALEVGEGHHDRVDFTRLDLMGQGFQGQHPSTLTQPGRPVQPYSGVT